MFYANNEQVKGIFLNGRNYNYLAYGFGKIIPEDRNAEQANISLAYKYLNQYRIEFGTMKDGYDNALVSPRFDKPDSNGVFHSPFTYYYNGNIIPTKEVNILITNGNYALRNALVYNDMNINGAINYFAENTDFQGHNVNTYLEGFGSSQSYFDSTVMSNCSNFHLRSLSRFSKGSQPTLYNCNNFSGWFNFVRGNDGTRYPGFRGFLEDCKDGVFNINCTNMHGGGNSANVTNYYNFSGIQGCNNIKLNITGSPWQVWPHDHSFSSNCNINTYNVISGFGYMNYCNFNVVLPKDSKPEMDKPFEFLNNAENCNYNLNALDSNLFNYRNEDWKTFLFDNLNNCSLNLALSNSTGIDFSFGNSLNNCNIQFDNINLRNYSYGWARMSNCNITGNVIKAENGTYVDFVTYSTNINLNVNASLTNNFSLLWWSSNINGNVVLGNKTWIHHSNNLILYLYNGNYFAFGNVGDSKFEFNNVNNVEVSDAYNSNFNMRNAVGNVVLGILNNVKFVERGGASYTITNLYNCYNSWIYANTIDGITENVYNTRLELKNNNAFFTTWRVDKCEIDGFPVDAHYTTSCTFRTTLEIAQTRFRSYFTWANVWPHATPRGSDGWNTWYSTNAGLESTANLSRCYLNDNNASYVNSSTISFDNNRNMITSLLTFYNGTVTANLPNYAMNIKLNVDCHNLNLGVFMAGPPHGLEYSSISADGIYCNTGNNYFVHMNYGTRIYCENFCNVAFTPVWRRFSDNYQPVLLINNYQHSNAGACHFNGGITRIGRLNYSGGMSVPLELYNGACMFINNTVLSATTVDNALLFLGTNVRIAGGGITVTNGGLVVNKANYSMDAIGKFVNRNNFAWNFTDSGPWGWRSLFDFCTNV